jgi:hypothetical protein
MDDVSERSAAIGPAGREVTQVSERSAAAR